jgi:hypothetical protein
MWARDRLFDPIHARKLLTALGRAYGRLPDKSVDFTSEQNAFLDRAVASLAQEGKVISVRLALLAEMVKGKPWTHGRGTRRPFRGIGFRQTRGPTRV